MFMTMCRVVLQARISKAGRGVVTALAGPTVVGPAELSRHPWWPAYPSFAVTELKPSYRIQKVWKSSVGLCLKVYQIILSGLA